MGGAHALPDRGAPASVPPGHPRSAELVARYRPTGPATTSEPGSLTHFLTERYALYATLLDGRVLRGDVEHDPWELAPAEAEIETQTITDAHGIDVAGAEPLLHYSERLDVVVRWPTID